MKTFGCKWTGTIFDYNQVTKWLLTKSMRRVFQRTPAAFDEIATESDKSNTMER